MNSIHKAAQKSFTSCEKKIAMVLVLLRGWGCLRIQPNTTKSRVNKKSVQLPDTCRQSWSLTTVWFLLDFLLLPGLFFLRQKTSREPQDYKNIFCGSANSLEMARTTVCARLSKKRFRFPSERGKLYSTRCHACWARSTSKPSDPIDPRVQSMFWHFWFNLLRQRWRDTCLEILRNLPFPTKQQSQWRSSPRVEWHRQSPPRHRATPNARAIISIFLPSRQGMSFCTKHRLCHG